MRKMFGRLVPAVLRHIEGYAVIAGEDAREATTFVTRRLIALLLAGACGFVALLMLCTWLLVLAWDTPWRAWVAAGLALLFAGAAVALALPALRRDAARHALSFSRVRGELSRDRELIERAFNGRDGSDGEQRADRAAS
jgi:uncharacterized membrane protein YqjE